MAEVMRWAQEALGFVLLFVINFCLVSLAISSLRWARCVNEQFFGTRKLTADRLNRRQDRYYKQMRTFSWGASLSIITFLLYALYWR